MYLYRSHLGGLYTTSEPLDYDAMYCEECGDSDTEIGYFADNDAEGIWNEIKPDNLCCIDCENKDCDYETEENCDKHSENYNMNSCGLLYGMKFIAENINFNKYTYVYLICEDEKTGEIYVDFEPVRKKFGQFHAIPNSFCFKKELEGKVAICLIPFVENIVKSPEKIAVIKDGKRTNIVYKCIVNRDADTQPDAVSWDGEGWRGWLTPSLYVPVENEKWIGDVLKKIF